jgi:hypothetical protein
MSLILRRCLDVEPYAKIAYDYYMQVAATGTYDIDKYVDEITRFCHLIDPHNVNLNPVRVYNVDTEQPTHANYSGQPNNRPPQTPGPQPIGYCNFLFLTPQEFEHVRNHHSDLENRLRSLWIELAEAGIVNMLTEFKTSTPRSNTVRNDGPPSNSKISPHAFGLPAQYPPRPSRANVVH